jgi:N-methylhydantoinase A
LKPTGHRKVRPTESESWIDTPVFERAALFPTARLEGPAVISQPDSTTLIPPGAFAVVDDMLNLRISPGSAAVAR